MQEFLIEFIENLPYEVKLLSVFIISMIPIIELRLAIPVGVAVGISPAVAIPIAVIGNLIPVPFIILFIKNT